jgi:hypothetical protein
MRVIGDPAAPRVRQALISLYGAVAAVVRDDQDAAEMMLADLTETLEDVNEVLMTISIATLERLEAAVTSGDRSTGGDGSADGGLSARHVLALAADFGLSSRRTVHAAAWRLDAVREGDRSRAAADIARSQSLGTETELTYGAIALLAAIVAVWANRTGRSPKVAASDLCLAASLAAVS